jgi:putative glutamine amidotransferase
VAANRPARIAIPLPHSGDRDYAERSIPQYEYAVQLAGGEPVRVPLDQGDDEVARLAASCDGVLLPGSSADVDPAKYGAERSAHTAAADALRDRADELLLREAYANGKPVLGICYGLQSLNVFQQGSLIQHIPDFLPEELRARVDHEAGKKVPVAHSVRLERGSKIARIVSPAETVVLPVNSSHHQSAGKIGEGLVVSARCAEDGIIEAMEGTDPDHFVVAVQWHPERSVELDQASRNIFEAFLRAAETHRPG